MKSGKELETSQTRIRNIVYGSSAEAAHKIGPRAEFITEKSTSKR